MIDEFKKDKIQLKAECKPDGILTEIGAMTTNCAHNAYAAAYSNEHMARTSRF